ncbi:hypothetical protein [Streptomyces sp. NBC_01538]|uniref:hypothetical protein n=1 Tax=Streptomyces sp. NBC_01538 TaxID=2903897 RepID=UPI0038656E34
MQRYGEAISTWTPAALEALIEEATVDAYGEDEQLTGFFTMIEESLAVPFTTTVLGVEVSVVGVDLAEDGRVVARCARGSVRQSIGIIRHQLLGADLRGQTDEHGAFSEEELAEARARIFGTTSAAGGASAA